MIVHMRHERKSMMPFCRRSTLCSVAMLALLGFPAPAMAFIQGYRCLGHLASLSRERKATRIGARAEVATSPTVVATNSDFHEGLTKLSLEEMEAWLDEAGVDRGSGTEGAPAVKLKCFEGRGIGLEATVQLERDSTVASIPRRVCFSSDAADAPSGTLRSWAHTILASIPPSPTRLGTNHSEEPVAFEKDVAVVTLQLFLERLAGRRSKFAPWMALLNQAGLSLPALWPTKDIEALKGTLVLREIEKCLKMAEVECNLMAVALATGLGGMAASLGGRSATDGFPELACLDSEGANGIPTQAEWLQARCTIQSRAYRVGGRYLLVPMVDFANHDDDVAFAICSGDGVFTGADEVVFVSDRRYSPGQEVCTTYGDMDNAKRLFSFGFVTLAQHGRWSASSVSDRLALPTESFCDIAFPVLATDPLLDFKESIIRECGREAEDGISSLSAVFLLTPSRPLVSQLVGDQARSFVESAMPVLRLAALTTEEFRSEALGDLCLWRTDTAAEEDRGNGTDNWPLINGVAARSSGQACVFPTAVLPGRGDEVLARFRARVSLSNDREALRLLSEQCCERLKGIDLNSDDVEALRKASARKRDGDGSDNSFTASKPRRLLCAAVRVGEAIAWHALLEACTRMTVVCVPAEEQTWASWVWERSRSTRR